MNHTKNITFNTRQPADKHGNSTSPSPDNQVNHSKILHCTKDKNVLYYVGAHRCRDLETKKSLIFPSYICPVCSTKHTSLDAYPDLEKINYNNAFYINVTEDGDRKRNSVVHQKHSDPSNSNPSSRIKCYVYGTKMPNACRSCGYSSFQNSFIKVPSKNTDNQTIPIFVKFCKQCKMYYVNCETYMANKSHLNVLNSIEANHISKELQSKAKEATTSNKKHVYLVKYDAENEVPQANAQPNTIQMKDFVVRRSTFKCKYQNHTLQNINAQISIINKSGDIVQTTIPAGYCSNCKMFFILQSTYENLKKKGTLICRLSDDKSYLSSGQYVNSMSLAHESLLMQYGYNVSQTTGLTSKERQKILALLIDNHIMSKTEIISYLDFFISQRKNQKCYMNAIEKWENDRHFVTNYNASNYVTYGVNRIYRKHRF